MASFSSPLKILKHFLKSSVEENGNGTVLVKDFLWEKSSGHHVNGKFSMAVAQANYLMEDYSQLESGPLSFSLDSGPQGTFVGVYDGHGGQEASSFIYENLFQTLKKFVSEDREMSANVIKKAFSAIEEGFLTLAKKYWLFKPNIASAGSACLMGIICNGLLYIANVGDSRVVLGKLDNGIGKVTAIQLSTEHNANLESAREEICSLHPHDPQIVVFRHGVWRVKKIIQLTRSIGDPYLKKAAFNKTPLPEKYRILEPFHMPILSAEPSILEQKLYPEDQFLIFASHGLWEHLSSQGAVDIVHNNPRNGIARRIVKAAIEAAARKREMKYSDVMKIDRKVRLHIFDDITVLVLFLDPHLISKSSFCSPSLSIKGGGEISNPIIKDLSSYTDHTGKVLVCID